MPYTGTEIKAFKVVDDTGRQLVLPMKRTDFKLFEEGDSEFCIYQPLMEVELDEQWTNYVTNLIDITQKHLQLPHHPNRPFSNVIQLKMGRDIYSQLRIYKENGNHPLIFRISVKVFCDTNYGFDLKFSVISVESEVGELATFNLKRQVKRYEFPLSAPRLKKCKLDSEALRTAYNSSSEDDSDALSEPSPCECPYCSRKFNDFETFHHCTGCRCDVCDPDIWWQPNRANFGNAKHRSTSLAAKFSNLKL